MNILPIDLIVATVMHEAVAQVQLYERIAAKARDIIPGCDMSVLQVGVDDAIARQLLLRIAKEAQIKHVYAALKAVGAPSSAELIQDGLQAVTDRLQT